MLRFLKNSITLILFLLVSFAVQAQKPSLLFEKITDKSGRSLGNVTEILQDDYGFMWFSTRQGLYKYDGYDYTLFKYNPMDSTSIPFNEIFGLHLDRQENLWISQDRIVPLSNEKVSFEFPQISNNTFGIRSEILDDSISYWVASAKGVQRFYKDTARVETFGEAQKMLHPHAYSYLQKLVDTKEPLAAIKNPGNNVDSTINFELKQHYKALILAVGEGDEFGIFDFATLYSDGVRFWQMDLAHTYWAGGDLKNQMEAKLAQLIRGNYQIRFQTDDSHSANNWNETQPDKTNFYGVVILPLTGVEYSELKRLLDLEYTPEDAISSKNVVDIIINRSGQVCLLNDNGIEIYKEGRFQLIPINFNAILNNYAEPVTLAQASDETYWIGTKAGLIAYNLETGVYRVYKNEPDNPESLTDNYISTIFEDSQKQIWVGTSNGLNIINPMQKRVYAYKSNNQNRLYDNKIFNIFEDNSNTIWVATLEGANKLIRTKFDHTPLNIETFDLAIIHTSDNELWYHGGENILINYKRDGSIIDTIIIDNEVFPNVMYGATQERLYTINALFEDVSGGIWITVGSSLLSYKDGFAKPEKKFKLSDIKWDSEFYTNRISRILQLDVGGLWLFALDGIYRYDFATNTFSDTINLQITNEQRVSLSGDYYKDVVKIHQKKYIIRNAEGVQVVDFDQKSVDDILVFEESMQYLSSAGGNIIKAHDNKLWMAALPYIYVFQADSLQKLVLALDNPDQDFGECRLYQDLDSLFWIASDNALYTFNAKTEEFRIFSISDGLIDLNVNGIVDDNQGNVWLSSRKGLMKYDKANDAFLSMFTYTDLQSFSFVRILSQSPSEILFLTSHGLLSFSPNRLNTHKPPVRITKFLLFGKEYDLDSLIYKKKHILLKHDQNFIGFEFAALDYTDPGQNRYMYKLEGIDKDWQTVEAYRRRAPYTSIPHGNYVFRVKASNNDNIWNNDGAAVAITITPPFWKTWWFITLEIITALLVIYLVIQARIRKLRVEKRILEQKVKERTAEIEKQKEEIGFQRDKIKEQHDFVLRQRDQIAEQQQAIMDSIHYASRIQTAILPPLQIISDFVPDFFILNKPRDIVSGDYYWLARRDKKFIIAAADCTGHGVPGAFMSMLGVAFLNEIVNNKNIIVASDILNELRSNVIKALHQTGQEGEAKDGMDIALAVIDMENCMLEFAGAYNPLYIVRAGELIQIKADRMPIGIHYRSRESFTNNEVYLMKGDTLYLFSDGFADQFGGDKGRKFMYKNFKTLLTEIAHKPMQEQKQILDDSNNKWRGKLEQVDDILVVGIRI